MVRSGDAFVYRDVRRGLAPQAFLQWYVNEQVEEENSPAEIISMLRLAGDTGAALLMVDRQLAERARE